MGNYLFGVLYSLMAIIGGIIGMYWSVKYGGWRSSFGRGMIFLSLGLFFEAFGQLSWTFYNVVLRVEVPYPSIADIGYFGIIPLYALGMLNFAKAAGVRFSLGTYLGKIQAVIIPIIMVAVSYFLFLRGYQLDFSAPLRVFLDLGYPLGEAITISIALITFMLSRNALGGTMRKRIFFIIFALIIQYVTDYTFLYRASRELYFNGGVVDLMYAVSFFVMTLCLIQFGVAYKNMIEEQT